MTLASKEGYRRGRLHGTPGTLGRVGRGLTVTARRTAFLSLSAQEGDENVFRTGMASMLGCLAMVVGLAGCDGTFNDDVIEMSGELHVQADSSASEPAAVMEGLDGKDLREQLARENIEPGWSDWMAWDTITFDRITLTIPASDTGDLTGIESIVVYETRPNTQDVEVASIHHVDAGVRAVELEVDGVDLTPDVLDDASKIRVEVHGATSVRELDVSADLRVDWPDDASWHPGPEG